MKKSKLTTGLNPEILTLLGLSILFYFIFIHNLWGYPLMDTDETRYVSMARDMYTSKEYLTLYLNGEYFFEKPPLFFWLECLSFNIFDRVNEFTARLPVAILGVLGCFSVYFIGTKIISRSYGIISSIILATSIEYCILSKMAILDIVISACIMFSLCFGLATFFCRDSRKKYYWWLFYIFSGLAVMAKGIPGVVIPFGGIFLIALVEKNLKEIFKPIHFIPGMLLFLLITLPWHIIMFKLHNPLFWNEYIIKHHLSRFLGSDEIDRAQPFYFYIVTLLWGFCPWILSTIFVLCKKTNKIKEIIKTNTIEDRFLLYNLIIILFILLFFTSSETKLITYILPIYPFLAFLAGYIWWNYIEYNRNEKIINITNYILGYLLILVAFIGLISPLFLPTELLNDFGSAKIFSILTSFACGFGIVLFTPKRLYKGVFASFVLFMCLFSAIATEKFFQIDYKFGQYDLMNFAQFAKENKKSITTFKFGSKYSLLYYGESPVIYGPQAHIWDINKALSFKDNFVIIKNKDIKKFEYMDFDIIKQGRKYSLIDKKEE